MNGSISVVQMKEEEKQREEAVTFKANPNTVTHKEPFQPKMESRIATGETLNIWSTSLSHILQ